MLLSFSHHAYAIVIAVFLEDRRQQQFQWIDITMTFAASSMSKMSPAFFGMPHAMLHFTDWENLSLLNFENGHEAFKASSVMCTQSRHSCVVDVQTFNGIDTMKVTRCISLAWMLVDATN